LIISAAALVTSFYSYKESTRVSTLALATARQANDISIGRIHEYPEINIAATGNLSLLTLPQQHTVAWNIWNTGNKPITALTVRLIVLSGLTYSLALTPMDEPKLFGDFVDYKIMLGEQLPPDAFVRLHMTKPVLTYLRNLRGAYADQTAAYRSSLNVIILPHESGTTPPIQSLVKKDRDILSIDYIPAVLRSDEFGKYVDTLEETNPIYVCFDCSSKSQN
jgi:hypothetical protein